LPICRKFHFHGFQRPKGTFLGLAPPRRSKEISHGFGGKAAQYGSRTKQGADTPISALQTLRDFLTNLSFFQPPPEAIAIRNSAWTGSTWPPSRPGAPGGPV